jgi:hypothetical protein
MTKRTSIRVSISFIGLICLLCCAGGAALAQDEVDVFTQQIIPLSTMECARCHEQAFTSLRDNGGAHKMDCRECHEQFHIAKKNISWEERVPACAGCHDQPHGSEPAMTACLTCHTNAHAPISSLQVDQLEPLCANCHAEPAAEMQQPSAHSDMGCSDCHQQRHGYLPKCTECHEEPHSTFESSTACMQCHPVHNVSVMLYRDDIPNSPCAGCHEQQAQQLNQGHLAHAKLNCTFCHANTHGNVPSCQDCHATPHSSEMMQDFASCAECHGNAHALLPGE